MSDDRKKSETDRLDAARSYQVVDWIKCNAFKVGDWKGTADELAEHASSDLGWPVKRGHIKSRIKAADIGITKIGELKGTAEQRDAIAELAEDLEKTKRLVGTLIVQQERLMRIVCDLVKIAAAEYGEITTVGGLESLPEVLERMRDAVKADEPGDETPAADEPRAGCDEVLVDGGDPRQAAIMVPVSDDPETIGGES